jgi:predicted amidohydrolase YtcJ
MQANLVLLNGKIVTMDAAGSTVEALAVGGDRIIAAGTNADVEHLSGNNTRTIDL